MKIAVVTGSTRGIGRGIAEALVHDGYQVVSSGTRAVPNVELPAGAVYIGCNIADGTQRKALFDQVMRRFGRLDVLVNNAGMAPRVRRDILDTTEESFDELIGTNYRNLVCIMTNRLVVAHELSNIRDITQIDTAEK